MRASAVDVAPKGQGLADPMLPRASRVLQVDKETHDTFTLSLEAVNGNGQASFAPGQFSMLYVFGVGELPISISGDPEEPGRLVYTVRSVGKATNALVTRTVGESVGVRGPFGTSWPMTKARGKDIVVIAGGIGLAPLRPAIYHILRHRGDYKRLIVLYGARTPADLSDVENLDFPEIGTLEAFNSDGLRSLLRTIEVPNMIEKTLRYPGHVEHIRALRDSGFFGTEEVEVGRARVRPLDVTSAVLFKHWHLHEEDDEFTVMRIIVAGTAGGRTEEIRYDLFDRRDRKTGFSSMARTTGFPAAAAAHLVLAGRFVRTGILPPEYLGADEAAFKAVMDDLAARNVVYRKSERQS